MHKMLPSQIFVGHISFFSQKTSCIVRNSSGIYAPLSGRFYQIEKYPGKNMYKYKFMQIGYWKCPITIPVLLTRTGICTQHSGSGQFGTRTCHPCSTSSLNFGPSGVRALPLAAGINVVAIVLLPSPLLFYQKEGCWVLQFCVGS